MLRFFALRALYMLPAGMAGSFPGLSLLIHLVPGDPIVQMLGEGAPVGDIPAMRHAYGLDLLSGSNISIIGKVFSTETWVSHLRFSQHVGNVGCSAISVHIAAYCFRTLLVGGLALSIPAGCTRLEKESVG
jgi:peptide/nickel transport system permease protein